MAEPSGRLDVALEACSLHAAGAPWELAVQVAGARAARRGRAGAGGRLA